MRLMELARFKFGLLWKSDMPELEWRNIANALLVVALFLAACAVSTTATENAELDSKRLSAEGKREKAELALVACLNGRPILSGDDTAIFCETHTTKM